MTVDKIYVDQNAPPKLFLIGSPLKYFFTNC